MSSTINAHMNWVEGYSARRQSDHTNTWIAEYRLSDLVSKGYIDKRDAAEFLAASGLSDFFWEITWPEDFETPDEYLVDRIANVQGYVIFVHGWTGNHYIWEELPHMIVQENRQLVAICLDHNGFGFSRFEKTTPDLESCNPPAAMHTVQRWIDLVKLRRQRGNPNMKVINLIGHSMGGATLFYLNPILWSYGEVTRYALAPALLLEDEMRQVFYTTLGIGISILQRLPVLEIFERFIKPAMVHRLTAGSSQFVKEVHSRLYEETPRGITGATFMAMGRLRNYEIARDFSLTRVMLGHRDPLVGLTDMMDLLGKLEFPAGHIRVVPGTHYMFSIGSETPMNAYQHAQNRELVIKDIVELHQRAYDMQRKGLWVG